MRDELATRDSALRFLLELTSSTHRNLLDQVVDQDDLVRLAADRGHDVTPESLSEAMKILIDRKLEHEGIPSWVRSSAGPKGN